MVRRRTFGCGWLLALFLVVRLTGAAQTPATGPIDAAEIDKLLKQFSVPGVSIAVIKDFKIDWAQGYGLADAEAGTRVTPAASARTWSTRRHS